MPQMEERIVKTLKAQPLKTTFARGALALVAAGSALALSACGAGQISQTSSQVAAVNGASGTAEHADVQDVTVVVGPDNALALKFTITNEDTHGKPVKVESVKVEGKEISGLEKTEIPAGGSLIADGKFAMEDIEAKEQKQLQYATTSIKGLDDVYVGGHKKVTFKLNVGEVELSAPVSAYVPEAGQLHRDEDGSLTDK
ncbi:putative secreted protein [Corynebacterium jeikeium]|uniref:Putative secreted protein n=2 Tax=Corynebacterium jeikeium TaxID=38289 RepID=Q4JXJ9_CORJK|nr:putative secreted protein [Corynebacterium jeikeium K411]SUY83933.1 putative secreted protein [Corynebacterium jeikeium]